MTEELKQKAIDFEKNWFDKDIAISDLLIKFATEVIKELQKDNEACYKENEGLVKRFNDLSEKNRELQEELDYAKSNCLFSDCDRVVRLKSQNVDLEKENARLKIKAKEIIREYMRFEPMIGTCSFYSEEYEKTKKKAEAFLKE